MFRKNELYNEFVHELKLKIKNNNNLVIVCIGTNYICGDCFGPLVGSKLKKLINRNNNIKIIGDMINPVNCKNIYKIIKKINHENKDSLIIAIDSALSDFDAVGNIFVTDSGISVASGVGKFDVNIGNVGIKACIGINKDSYKENIMLLKHTSIKLVEKLSDIVSLGIKEVCVV